MFDVMQVEFPFCIHGYHFSLPSAYLFYFRWWMVSGENRHQVRVKFHSRRRPGFSMSQVQGEF